ncbi:hypothetical protein D8Y20_07260 [Mariprofundus sp. EBB-1]|uniref:hypothetical protein n=1 Tax=Mariprofundus sp. EBB-1 TaxID=2650971 RepID=UPI000EF1E184|nr:hypothetical protein [Mariprofundus sp. EBB-1]RLL52304.1 hypothetical protein D8Y20_07260 [Mariprofundus sp. EBB-1]
MIVIDGHMNFFKVNKCGLYKANLNKPFGCELEETIDLIGEWIMGKPLQATIPWDPSSKTSVPKCYCKDFYKDEDTGDFLLVLWKSDSDSAGTIWGAEEDKAAGAGKVIEYTNKYGGKKVIWGRPCYYWIIPSLNTVVSIKFDHSVCDAIMFSDYISSAVENRVKHSNKNKTQTATGQIRLSFSDDKTPYNYRYRFDMGLRSLLTSSVELKSLVSSVTHIIKRETVLVDVQNKRGGWVRTLNKFLPKVSLNPKMKQRHIEVKAEASPTVEEIKDIIEKYAKENRKPKDWNNVGFLNKDGQTTWADRYRLHSSIKVAVDNVNVFGASQLYDEIRGKRDMIIKPLLSDKALKKIGLVNE